jgi:hypothetical protein
MTKNAYLKIDRAAKHINELNELFHDKRPFRYVVETNTHTRQRATYAKKDEAVADEAAIIAGDALHCLRTALDYAYWNRVSPLATSDRERKKVQFPFSETAARLDAAVASRLAKRVSPEFFHYLVELRPHGEAGGNEMLYLLHDRDTVDKHRDLVPTGDYKKLSSEIVRRQVPDFPEGIIDGGFGQNHRDVVWPLHHSIKSRLGLPGLPLGRILEHELDVPVDVVFQIRGSGSPKQLIPTLHVLSGMVRNIVKDICAA